MDMQINHLVDCMSVPHRFVQWIDRIDRAISRSMWRIGLPLMRYAIGLVFLWFGALKLLGISPAADLVAATVVILPPETAISALGLLEVVIGACFLIRSLLRLGIFLLLVQLPGTFLPMILLPDIVYTVVPYGLTVEGQYIVKNLVIMGAALVIGGTIRGERQSTPHRPA